MVKGCQWTPSVIGDLFLKEVLYYFERLEEEQELEEQSQLAAYKMWLTLIHGDPQEVLEKLEQIEKGETCDDEIGDLKAIERLQAERGWNL